MNLSREGGGHGRVGKGPCAAKSSAGASRMAFVGRLKMGWLVHAFASHDGENGSART